jgi:hypothetical protein
MNVVGNAFMMEKSARQLIRFIFKKNNIVCQQNLLFAIKYTKLLQN